MITGCRYSTVIVENSELLDMQNQMSWNKQVIKSEALCPIMCCFEWLSPRMHLGRKLCGHTKTQTNIIKCLIRMQNV